MDRDLDWCDLNASYGMIEGDGFHIMDKKNRETRKMETNVIIFTCLPGDM
jgi:hypothetical protein